MLTARAPAPGELEREAYRGLPPPVVGFLAKKHAMAAPADIRAANMHRMISARRLRAARVAVAYDETAVAAFADNYSQICLRLPLPAAENFARSHGIEPPGGPGIKPEGARARLISAAWWRRTLRHTWGRQAENGMRDLGMVRRGAQPYASDAAVESHADSLRRVAAFLENHEMVSDEGESLPLLELAKHSLSQPALRRGELMTRLRGFNEIAAEHGHACTFATLTAPSAYHAELADGARNPSYQGFTVREAQDWLTNAWERSRAALGHAKIPYYGFRAAEPHHDGTPHWHMVVFTPAWALERFQEIVRAKWLAKLGDEPGAATRRCEFKAIDVAGDGAVGYLAKYVSKNIDGFGSIGGANDLETGARINAGVVRVTTWARLHGIRQFQQLGGPAIGLYREARRLRVPSTDAGIEAARAPADAGDFAGFIKAIGGIDAGRRTLLTLERIQTGELNRYGELRPAAIVGLRYCSTVAITRTNNWELKRKCTTTTYTTLGPASGSASSSSRSSSPDWQRKNGPDSAPLLPWTRGNNCTGLEAGGYALNLSGMPSLWSTLRENSQGPPKK